jgi:hypothetical protein
LQLKPSSRIQGVVSFGYDGREVVVEAGEEESSVDVVESVGIGPVVFDVVYFEAAVGWYAESMVR